MPARLRDDDIAVAEARLQHAWLRAAARHHLLPEFMLGWVDGKYRRLFRSVTADNGERYARWRKEDAPAVTEAIRSIINGILDQRSTTLARSHQTDILHSAYVDAQLLLAEAEADAKEHR